MKSSCTKWPKTAAKWFLWHDFCNGSREEYCVAHYLVSPCIWPVIQLFQSRPAKFLVVTNAGLKRAVRAEGALLPSNHCWRAAIFFLLYLASIFNLSLLFCSLSMRSSFIKILMGNKCREKTNISRGEGEEFIAKYVDNIIADNGIDFLGFN